MFVFFSSSTYLNSHFDYSDPVDVRILLTQNVIARKLVVIYCIAFYTPLCLNWLTNHFWLTNWLVKHLLINTNLET